MGQEVEPYFQEVLATLEQCVEDGYRGEGGMLNSRLQQLYSEIVSDSDAGMSSLAQTCVEARCSFSVNTALWTLNHLTSLVL